MAVKILILITAVVVLSETPDRFTYEDDFGSSLNFKPKNNQYFLEDKLEFLDNPGEWFYDKSSKTLYVMTLSGSSPEGSDVRGKVYSCHNNTLCIYSLSNASIATVNSKI